MLYGPGHRRKTSSQSSTGSLLSVASTASKPTSPPTQKGGEPTKPDLGTIYEQDKSVGGKESSGASSALGGTFRLGRLSVKKAT